MHKSKKIKQIIVFSDFPIYHVLHDSRLMLLKFYEKAQIGLIQRTRHYWKNMDCDILHPPSEVRGMRVLNREAFNKTVSVPRLWVPEDKSQRVMPMLKKYLLKMEKLKAVRPLQLEQTQGREILLHPLPIKEWSDLPIAELKSLDLKEEHFVYTDLSLSYQNWKADEILKSILPKDEEAVTSFSKIGHIIHLNLRDHLLDYAQVIGQVLIDKIPNCKSVVNKSANIDNTYRNFQFDLLCGEANYQVETKENGIIFEFDFSKVYWNPRLSTEHERIVNMLKPNDVLYDVFAGVGPFAVPAAKKKCHVLANDLNPESFRWLQHNMKRNKCQQQAKVFNKDGRDFIAQDLKTDLLDRWQKANDSEEYKIHITMNLPALSVEFLNEFRGLYEKEYNEGVLKSEHKLNFPLVHVYSFAKGTNTKELVLQLVEENLQMKLGDNLEGIYFVRNVAPNKDMYRVSFYLTEKIIKESIKDKMADTNLKRKVDVEAQVEDSSKCKVLCS